MFDQLDAARRNAEHRFVWKAPVWAEASDVLSWSLGGIILWKLPKSTVTHTHTHTHTHTRRVGCLVALDFWKIAHIQEVVDARQLLVVLFVK